MSKTTKIVLVGFAFSLFCFLVLLTFSASRPAHISESPAVTAVRPDDRPSPMAAPEMEKSTRKENAGTSDAPKGVVPGPIPTQASSPEVRTPVPRYDEEVRKRVREQIAQDRKRADMDKLVTGYVPSKVGDVIDQILAEMDFGNIAFNSPDKMKLNSPSNIQLVVSPTETIEKLKESIVAEGQKHGEQIRISDTMEARLTGTAFQIGAITPEVQGITGKEVTNWKWEVRPTQYGRHKLHLTLSALVTLKGSSVPRSIRTFERTIEVEVSSWQKHFYYSAKTGNGCGH